MKHNSLAMETIHGTRVRLQMTCGDDLKGTAELHREQDFGMEILGGGLCSKLGEQWTVKKLYRQGHFLCKLNRALQSKSCCFIRDCSVINDSFFSELKS